MSLVEKKANCCVIGAGVSGLTTAIELLNREFRVTLISDAIGPETTSSAAAAFWYPFWTGPNPDHSWYRPIWAWNTFLALEKFTGVLAAGVTRTRLFEYFDSEMSVQKIQDVIDGMWWRAMPGLNFQELSGQDVSRVTCQGRRFQSGLAFDTLVINMRYYLQFLYNEFLQLRGELIDRHLTAIDVEEICGKFDFVVNCAGLGARDLVSESRFSRVEFFPTEGIVIRMSPLANVRNILLAHTGKFFEQSPVYIVPRGGPEPDIILGGTISERQEGNPRQVPWKEVEGEQWKVQQQTFQVLRSCRSLERDLAEAAPIGISVGYRPTRKPAARVEPEFERSDLIGRLFHNYGHGGGGVTLSWGCAKEIANWIEWFRPADQRLVI